MTKQSPASPSLAANGKPQDLELLLDFSDFDEEIWARDKSYGSKITGTITFKVKNLSGKVFEDIDFSPHSSKPVTLKPNQKEEIELKWSADEVAGAGLEYEVSPPMISVIINGHQYTNLFSKERNARYRYFENKEYKNTGSKRSLYFIGSSAAWQIPRFRHPPEYHTHVGNLVCHQCSEAKENRKFQRNRSSAIFDHLLIDTGPDFATALRSFKGYFKPKYLLLTHAHPDHILGLDDLSYLFKGPPGDYPIRHLPTFGSYETLDKLRSIFPYLCSEEIHDASKLFGEITRQPHSLVKQENHLNEYLKRSTDGPSDKPFPLIAINPEIPIMLSSVQGQYIITPKFTEHMTGSYAWHIEVIHHNPTTILYAADIAKLTTDMLENVDVYVGDGSILEESTSSHLSIMAQLEILKSTDTTEIIFTHIGHHKLANMEFEKLLRINGGRVAYDGDTLRINLQGFE